MMPKQLPDASQDPGMKEDARKYANGVYNRLKATDIEKAIQTAYLMGAKSGFCYGYRVAELEAKKVYEEAIRELKKIV